MLKFKLTPNQKSSFYIRTKKHYYPLEGVRILPLSIIAEGPDLLSRRILSPPYRPNYKLIPDDTINITNQSMMLLHDTLDGILSKETCSPYGETARDEKKAQQMILKDYLISLPN